jgi:hypothetical protein
MLQSSHATVPFSDGSGVSASDGNDGTALALRKAR